MFMLTWIHCLIDCYVVNMNDTDVLMLHCETE